MFRKMHLTQHATPRRQFRLVRRLLFLFAAIASATQLARGSGPVTRADWLGIGQDPAGSHNQPLERTIGRSSVGRLAPKWVATTAGDVSATPVVTGGAVYFPDWGGRLWKLDAATGQVIWSHLISDYDGIPGDVSRTSPAFSGNLLFVGENLGAYLIAIDARSGALVWITQAEPDPTAISTGSPVVAGERLYMGFSSRESAYDAQRGIQCCTFRGSLVSLEISTGHVVWRSYGIPDNGRVAGAFAGATIITPPAVDTVGGLVYDTFGNLYSQPASVTACLAASPFGFDERCLPSDAYFKSLVAFDIRTGAPRWSYRVQGHDPWLRACGRLPVSVTWCAPETDLVSWDFGGSGPNVFQVRINGRLRTVVGVGEKSGVYLLFEADTGNFLWNTLVGPGSDQGGMEWGTATDGERIYVAIGNQNHVPYRLVSGESATGGSWAALDPSTGQILWQTGDPQGALDLSPVTVANGVVYASSMARTGNQMFALDAVNGAVLWSFAAGSSVNAGPAVVDGTVYWGAGYNRLGLGSGNTKFYAFSLDGR
jgi:polyvinyl alcohol dehydrogenase (cytochrome)